jgi:hypothetical protein
MGVGKILSANPPDFRNIGGHSDDIRHPVLFFFGAQVALVIGLFSGFDLL